MKEMISVETNVVLKDGQTCTAMCLWCLTVVNTSGGVHMVKKEKSSLWSKCSGEKA